MFDSSVGYTGRVTIRIKNKPPVRKFNAGTISLFNVLSDCLAKSNLENIDEFIRRMPWYIDVLNPNATDNENYKLSPEHISEYSSKYNNTITELGDNMLSSYSILRAPMLISRSNNNTLNSDNNNAGLVELFSMLNSSNIENNDITDSSQLYVCLIDGLQQNILAFVEINGSVISTLSSSAYGQAEIEWQLQISNSKGDIK